jgi:DNA-binding NarL/FixJ family response regulator
LIDYNLNAILTNSDNLIELEKAIFTVANGNNYYSSSMLKNPIILKRVIDYYRGKQMKSLLKFSKREIEILKNMKKRTSSKQIADKLCISVRTVSKHKENIYRKLGVNNMNSFFEIVKKDKELQQILN